MYVIVPVFAIKSTKVKRSGLRNWLGMESHERREEVNYKEEKLVNAKRNNGGKLDHNEDEEGWTRVKKRRRIINRKHEQMDAAFRRGLAKESTIVTYFLTRFSDTHSAKEMYGFLKLYGNVVDVGIPAKKDRRGKRFSFARFIEFRDPELFAIRLDNIIIGSTKIIVNIPRFESRSANGVLPGQVRGA